MNGDEKKLNQGIELTNLQCADMIDWNVNCFPIGVKVEGKENEMPWLELDRDDLRALELMLTRKLLVPSLTDPRHHDVVTPAMQSDSMNKLLGWVRAVSSWMDSRRPRG